TRHFVVQQTEVQLTTTATPGGTVGPGSAQHDVATISAPPGMPAPAGHITFTLCGPAETDATGCPVGSGAQIGLPVSISAGSAPSVNVATRASPLAPGTYCWRADYAPDASQASLYLPSSHTDTTAECFTVTKASPVMATQIQTTGDGSIAVTTFG